MYHQLDTPPPPSQLYQPAPTRHRPRPWSPEPYDSYDYLPSTLGSSNDSRETFNRLQRSRIHQGAGDDDHDRSSRGRGPQRQDTFMDDYPPLPEEQFPRLTLRPSRRRQEASEVSVEALDLADYARTLRSRQAAEDPYPPFRPAESSSAASTSSPRQGQRSPPVYPPSSFPNFIRGGTRSSANTSTTATHHTPQSTHSLPVGSRRRPFSLPSSPYNHSAPNLVPDPEQEVDVTQFPSWTREWYNDSTNRNGNTHLDQLEEYEMKAGFAPPRAFVGGSSSRNSRASLQGKPELSPFDPAYIHPESYPKGRVDPFDDNLSYPSYSAPSYSNHDPLLGYNDSGRDGVVPWSLDPPEYKNLPVDPQVKEERIRMLEREFGSDKKGKKKAHGHAGSKHLEKDDELMRDDNGKLVIGTPDGKGGLVTQGPKTRAAALKPEPAPPPAGKPPFYILAVLAPITLLLLAYLFLIRPCTTRRKYPSHPHPGAQGMMVLPVQGGGGGKGKKWKGGPKPPFPGGKKGKKGPFGGPPGDVQVNLIVDPNAFSNPSDDISSSSSSDEYDEGGFPAGFFDRHNPKSSFEYQQQKRKEKDKARRKRNRRRTLMASLKLEEEWKSARRWVRIVSFVDTFACVVWAVAFGFVLAGKRCPTGGEEKGYELRR
ncbi:hypothetical protein CC1G_01016 [Coprinopsis cinerea okayama7|uniref:Uncharacterized protein n=1 Tax=Coprinopsis cinerea (strain Okayama-7 / 130 / ATCC MYA-4618 / FGSC 9003) TaxID=240176 RepID=A8NE78_COPC7|nr:hypothetical protein CC1G_01016 [Coprinopsis cinerea okayama7\|eukprot:XP_001832954.2 hypothetical protein CC1G_01016 [Coprinopsis cinerea okayama7\